MEADREIQNWIDRLGASQLEVRRQAAEELLQGGMPAAGIAPAALLRLTDSDETVRESIVGWLEGCGAPSRDDLARLLPTLNANDEDSVYWCITLLGRMGLAASSAAEPLLAKLGEDHPLPIRERAAWALGKIGRGNERAKAALQLLAKCDSPRLARLAAESLREIS